MRLTAENLAQPVSEELPCGEDLEYDPVFQQMELMMQTTEEQEFGDTIIAGTGPDWKGVREQVDDLIERTRDLRVITFGALAELNLNGLVAFSDAMDGLNVCLATYWADIHPQLDEDDNNDATMRLNTLQMMNDHDLVYESLMRAPLVEMKGIGSFSLRDIELAEGKLKPVADEEVHDIALIRGAFSESSTEDMVALGEGVSSSIEYLKRMAELWDELAPAEPAIDLSEALSAMNDVMTAITNYAPAAAAAAVGDDPDADEEEGVAAPQAQQALSGSINSRNDVSRAIDKICDYYTEHEPSSPIPLLLRRAQRLVPKNFMEILEDMAPTSLEYIEVISGTTTTEEESY